MIQAVNAGTNTGSCFVGGGGVQARAGGAVLGGRLLGLPGDRLCLQGEEDRRRVRRFFSLLSTELKKGAKTSDALEAVLLREAHPTDTVSNARVAMAFAGKFSPDASKRRCPLLTPCHTPPPPLFTHVCSAK